MKNLDVIAEELFNKIRGRFPSVTIGDAEGNVTNEPDKARFFDFDFKEGEKNLGKVSMSLEDNKMSVMYSADFVENEDTFTKEKWYAFLKELRSFSKKRLLNFDTRNINKSNLNRRDYKFLAQNRSGEVTMESKMYGTSKQSFQDVGTARLVVKHARPVNIDLAAGRTQHINSIYIESAEGERFKYPYKHLNGARAMARHVAEGGKPYDDFGSHITEMSEELSKLRKFKTYMNRSSVMAESLSEYLDTVHERIETIKNRVSSLQRENSYKEAFEGFEKPILEDVPNDVAENWIEQLTIKQFNEELKDVFPYIYRLIGEATRAKELGPEDLMDEEQDVNDSIDNIETNNDSDLSEFESAIEEMMGQFAEGDKMARVPLDGPMTKYTVQKGDTLYSLAKKIGTSVDMLKQLNRMDDDNIQVGQELNIPESMNEDYGPEDDEFHKGIHVKLGGDPDKWKPHRDRPVDGDHVELKVPMRYKAVEDKLKKLFSDLTDIDVDVLDVDYTKGQRTVMIDGETPHPSILSALNGTLDKFDTGEHTGLYKEGNKFSGELEKARKQGKDEMEVDGKKIPVTEFVLSFFDRETGQFPKGETAVLTKVEKEYGDQFITPAKQFIEAINNKIAEMYGYQDDDLEEEGTELDRIRGLAGL